jgi:hypothetical protein
MNNNSHVQKAETPIFAHWGLGNGKGYPAPDLYLYVILFHFDVHVQYIFQIIKET